MPSFFTSSDGTAPIGRTIGCPDHHTSGSERFFEITKAEGNSITWRTHRSIITRITMAMSGNFQFLHTIGNDVYVYAFGDRVGQVTISGLSMTASCDNEDSDKQHGIEKVYEWYTKNRVAKRKSPIEITIGQNTALQGFVIGLSGDAVDPQTRIMQYGLQLAVLPEKR
jgi:hypothetical protein